MVRGKCTVCDSPNATNYHFGAQSCKACAAFFRRSIAMGQTYDCLGDGSKSCRIDHTLRLNCRHCRLRKCLRAGMIKDLVQAKREIKTEVGAVVRKFSPSEEQVVFQPSTSVYFEPPQPTIPNYSPDVFYPASENEWDYSPPQKAIKIAEDIMGYDELQQFIKMPVECSSSSSSAIDELQMTDIEFRSRMNSMSDAGSYLSGLEEEERIYGLAALYMDQTVNLNMRRKITYTDKQFDTVFDGACVCPYDKSDLKLFDHRTYRQKNRNDYTMILDYINRFPDFQLLAKSEKNVLFRTAAAVDLLVDQSYYSQIIFPDESIMVTANGEYISMDPLPHPENEKDSGKFSSDDDYHKYKSLVLMKRRQWQHVVQPLKKLNLSLSEFALFKALTIWHYNYYKLQDNGKAICARQRDEIFRTLVIICEDEGHDDALLRAAEIVLAMGNVMAEVHEMVTSYIEIMVLDVLDDPILKDMLKFQY